ncbi:MAG: hypothetical protein NVS1B16_02610 [Pseudarthrobacter sp.]
MYGDPGSKAEQECDGEAPVPAQPRDKSAAAGATCVPDRQLAADRADGRGGCASGAKEGGWHGTHAMFRRRRGTAAEVPMWTTVLPASDAGPNSAGAQDRA